MGDHVGREFPHVVREHVDRLHGSTGVADMPPGSLQGLQLVVADVEAARAAQIYSAYRFNYSSFVVAAFLFILMTIPLARLTDWLVERDRRRRQAGAVT